MLAIECTGVQFTFLKMAVPAAEEKPLELLVTDPTESVCRLTCDTLSGTRFSRLLSASDVCD